MKIHSLIFSDKLPYRIQRHILFWTIRFLLVFFFNFSASAFTHIVSPSVDNSDNWLLSYRTGSFRLMLDMAYCYTIVYWLLPRYLPEKKYLVFGLLLSVVTLISYIANSFFVIWYYDLMNQPREALYKALWYQSIMFINSGPPVVCVLFLTIKMLKTWYLKEEEKIAIARENANAELQLLKAQIHPHFLFNTLNNIYSFTLAGHPNAAGLVTKLSGLMDYMNTEGEKDRVSAEKEIQLIKDYISLEKIRYGDRLDMQVEINGDYENKMIAPLLMIPFVENCFKHGASLMRGKQWVRLNINIKDNYLCFDLSNSKPWQPVTQNGRNGIGLMNVQKRLQLIYPGKHILKIESTDTVFTIHLEIELEQPASHAGDNPIHQSQSLSYA